MNYLNSLYSSMNLSVKDIIKTACKSDSHMVYSHHKSSFLRILHNSKKSVAVATLKIRFVSFFET